MRHPKKIYAEQAGVITHRPGAGLSRFQMTAVTGYAGVGMSTGQFIGGQIMIKLLGVEFDNPLAGDTGMLPVTRTAFAD